MRSLKKLALLFAVLAQAEWAVAAERRTVSLVPLGPVSPSLLKAIERAVTERYDVTVRLEPERPVPPQSYYPPRKRYRAEKILDALDADPPPFAWKVLAVTAVEISTTKDDIPDWGIGGLGSLGGRSCVLSTYLVAKHSKTAALFTNRMEKLALHEFGHTLGLPHCPDTACVMSDAKGKLIRSLDRSAYEVCDRCRAALRSTLEPER